MTEPHNRPMPFRAPAVPPPPPPPVKPANGRAIVWTLGVAVLVVIVIVWGFSGGDNSSSGSPSGDGGVSVAAQDDSLDDSLPANDDDLPTQMSKWFDAVQGDFTAVQQDEQAVADASSEYDVDAIDTGCADLASDSDSFMSDLPSPDQQVDDALTDAMHANAHAAASCLDGDYTTTASFMDDSTAAIERATDRITEIAGG